MLMAGLAPRLLLFSFDALPCVLTKDLLGACRRLMLVCSVLGELVLYSLGHLLLLRGGFGFSLAARAPWALQRGLDVLPAPLCPKVDHRHCRLSRLVRRRYFVVSVGAV